MSSKWRTVPRRRRGKGDEADDLGNRKQRMEELKCEGNSSDLRAERVPRSVARNEAGDDDEAGEDDGEDGDGDGDCKTRVRAEEQGGEQYSGSRVRGRKQLNDAIRDRNRPL